MIKFNFPIYSFCLKTQIYGTEEWSKSREKISYIVMSLKSSEKNWGDEKVESYEGLGAWKNSLYLKERFLTMFNFNLILNS